MTTATGDDDALPLDEDGFGRALDRISPALLGLARCVTSDDAIAERMVEDAWRSALRGEVLGPLPVALARRMAVAAPDDPSRLGTARQLLRVVLASGGRASLPGQRDRRWDAAAADASLDAGISALPPVQRVALVLHDVHGWPVRDVQTLLGVGSAGWCRLIGQARDRLVPSAVGEAV